MSHKKRHTAIVKEISWLGNPSAPAEEVRHVTLIDARELFSNYRQQGTKVASAPLLKIIYINKNIN